MRGSRSTFTATATGIVLSLILTGCSQQEQTSTRQGQTQTNAPPAARSEIVDHMTGYTQIKAGQKAKEDMKKVSAEHNKDLDEITK